MGVRTPLLPARIRWAFAVGLAGIIFYVSVVSVPDGTPWDAGTSAPLLESASHAVGYLLFGGSLVYATAHWSTSRWRSAAFVLSVTVLYGVGIEFAQSLVVHPFFSVEDALAKALGGVLVMPWYLVRSRVEFVPLGEWGEEPDGDGNGGEPNGDGGGPDCPSLAEELGRPSLAEEIRAVHGREDTGPMSLKEGVEAVSRYGPDGSLRAEIEELHSE